MKNPWEEIELSDYENHMQLDSVMQLQALNKMMQYQLNTYPVKTIMILGIAGGNGLEYVDTKLIKKVYGVDINKDYLTAVKQRYGDLDGCLECLCLDLLEDYQHLPSSELLIADLLIEYIGYPCFKQIIKQVSPTYVSCIIQINMAENWVSNSPYSSTFDQLDSIHHQIDATTLTKMMQELKFAVIKTLEYPLPNKKKLAQLDFKRI